MQRRLASKKSLVYSRYYDIARSCACISLNFLQVSRFFAPIELFENICLQNSNIKSRTESICPCVQFRAAILHSSPRAPSVSVSSGLNNLRNKRVTWSKSMNMSLKED